MPHHQHPHHSRSAHQDPDQDQSQKQPPQADPDQAPAAQHNLTQDSDIVADLQQQLDQLRLQTTQAVAQSQRALADYANLKKRFDKERLEIMGYATESMLSQLLPALDNLDRAMQYASDQDRQSSLFQGLSMTMDQVHHVFTSLGVTPIQADPDQDFDPHLHEAIDSIAGPQGKIVRQLQPGFSLNGKVIRPAQVAVGNGQSDA